MDTKSMFYTRDNTYYNNRRSHSTKFITIHSSFQSVRQVFKSVYVRSKKVGHHVWNTHTQCRVKRENLCLVRSKFSSNPEHVKGPTSIFTTIISECKPTYFLTIE